MRLSMQRLSSPLLELNGFKCLAVSVALLCVGLLTPKRPAKCEVSVILANTIMYNSYEQYKIFSSSTSPSLEDSCGKCKQ